MSHTPSLTFVGGGYRTVSFLAHHPSLIPFCRIIEAGPRIGPGAFQDYDCVSTSVSSRFVGRIAPEIAGKVPPEYGLDLLADPAGPPVLLPRVARAMEGVGNVISDLTVDGQVRTCSRVRQLVVESGQVAIQLQSGEALTSKHVIIATGREERPHPDLDPWRHKTVLSSQVLSYRYENDFLRRLAQLKGPVVIAGGSHSAVAALSRLLRIGHFVDGPPLEVEVVRRSPVRLHYQTVNEALLQNNPWEAAVDLQQDVCPETGQVNRDSGLRGAGRELFVQAVCGRLPHVRVSQYPSLEAAAHVFDAAGLVVQALGYRGRAPEIALPDGTVREAYSEDRLYQMDDGTALIDGRPVKELSILRVEPTPLDRRDHGLYGQSLYELLAARLSVIASDAI